jgi:hypothetical protein
LIISELYFLYTKAVDLMAIQELPVGSNERPLICQRKKQISCGNDPKKVAGVNDGLDGKRIGWLPTEMIILAGVTD